MATSKRGLIFEGLNDKESENYKLQIALLLAFFEKIPNLQHAEVRDLYAKELYNFFENPRGKAAGKGKEIINSQGQENFLMAQAIVDPLHFASAFSGKGFSSPESELMDLFAKHLAGDPKAKKSIEIVKKVLDPKTDQKDINEIYLTLEPILKDYNKKLKVNQEHIDKTRTHFLEKEQDKAQQKTYAKSMERDISSLPKGRMSAEDAYDYLSAQEKAAPKYHEVKKKSESKVSMKEDFNRYKEMYSDLKLPKSQKSQLGLEVKEKDELSLSSRESLSRREAESKSKFEEEQFYSPTRKSPATINRSAQSRSPTTVEDQKGGRKRNRTPKPRLPGGVSSDDED